MARKKCRRENPPPAEASAASADHRTVVTPPRRQRREGPPTQWLRFVAPAGHPFFYRVDTKESTWVHPLGNVQILDGPSQWAAVHAPTEQSAREGPVDEGLDSGSATSRWLITADGLQLQRRASPSQRWASRNLLPSLPTPPALVPLQQRMEEKQLLHRQRDLARLATSGRWHFFSCGVVLGSSLEPPSAEDLEDLDRDAGATP